MNDLATYFQVRDQIRPGDLIFFDGSDDSNLVEIAEHLVSNAIEVLTRSNWSHVAMVLDPDLLVNGQTQIELNLIESTTLTGKDGPQINALARRLAEYDGTSIWWFPLDDATRDCLDFERMWDLMLPKVGTDHYSYDAIVDFLLRPLFGWLVPALHRGPKNAEVCSEYVAEGLKAGGVELRLACALQKPAYDLDCHETSPGSLSRLPIFKTPVRLVPAQAQGATA